MSRRVRSTYSQAQAARRLEIGRKRLKKAIDAGEIKVNDRREIPVSALDAFRANPPAWLAPAQAQTRAQAHLRAEQRAASQAQRLARLRALPPNQHVQVSFVEAALRGCSGTSNLPELAENETGMRGLMSAGYALMLWELTASEPGALAELVREQRACGVRPPEVVRAPVAPSISADELRSANQEQLRTLKREMTQKLTNYSGIKVKAFERYCMVEHGAGAEVGAMTEAQLRACVSELAGWVDQFRAVRNRDERAQMAFYLFKDIAHTLN